MYENDFFYAETPVPDVKFHVWNIQIHTSIQQRQKFYIVNNFPDMMLYHICLNTYNKI